MTTYTQTLEAKLGAVEAAGAEQGWHIIAVSKDRHDPSTVPSGVVAFVRQGEFPDGWGRCGTARWGLSEAAGVHFFEGHYDLRRDDALRDFAERSGCLD